MANRTDEVSQLFREFAAFTIRNSAIDFHPHNIADLLDAIEVQQELGRRWTADELVAVESEATDFDDDDPSPISSTSRPMKSAGTCRTIRCSRIRVPFAASWLVQHGWR